VEFREKGNILLATTVVEVGISLPRLTTVVISGAERLGLATLHQLKGRVSRTGLKGYCYLYTNQNDSERLNEFIKTKNGFEVAELDLKFRKSGDLLDGIAQSGEHFEYFDMREDGDILQEAKRLLNQ
jgi:ATP-dependent DNA helicase RecG